MPRSTQCGAYYALSINDYYFFYLTDLQIPAPKAACISCHEEGMKQMISPLRCSGVSRSGDLRKFSLLVGWMHVYVFGFMYS